VSRRAALTITVFAVVGCEFTPPGGPTRFPKSSVEGAVLLAGRPLPNGATAWVTFYPEGSARGDVTVCRVNADGNYRSDHAPVGPLNVRIDVAPSVLAGLPFEVRRWVQVLRGPGSPLRMETREGEVTRFDFDLRPPR
jgi:hypothetical protein